MEDSYTVHRRRKAATKRREKTPEPPKRQQDDAGGTDEDEDARARMERLVQETERLEEIEENERKRAELVKMPETSSLAVAEKPQRVLKRAVSPEVHRKNEEVDKENLKFETKAVDEVSSSIIHSEKTGDKVQQDGTKIISDTVTSSPKVTEQMKDPEVSRKLKKEEINRPVKRRADVQKEFSPEPVERPARLMQKAPPPELERFEKGRTDAEAFRISGEWSKEATGGSSSSRKSSSRADNDNDDERVEEVTVSNENRYKAAASLAREHETRPTRNVDADKSETVKIQDFKTQEDDNRPPGAQNIPDKATRHTGDSVRVRKREVISPSKTQSPECRAKSATIKRSGKERNERTGYTTDSSETEETVKRVLRRKKSPEGPKSKSASARKSTSKSRVVTDTDGDAEEQERSRKIEKRSTSRRRPSTGTDEDASFRQRAGSPTTLEKRDMPRVSRKQMEKSRDDEKRSSRSIPPSDTDDDPRPIRKSDTFPVDHSREQSSSVIRSSSEIRKQIIPLDDDSLIQDFEKAQREYLRKERGILDPDPFDDYVNPKMEAALRRRKFSIVGTESEVEKITQQIDQPAKRSWFGWLPFFGKKANETKIEDERQPNTIEKENSSKKKIKEELRKEKEKIIEEVPAQGKVSILQYFRTLADLLSEFRAFVEQNPREARDIRILRNRCIGELILTIIYCGLGAFIFRFTEGAFETFYKCGVKRVKRDFLDSLWNFSHNMREEDWKSMARRKLMEFEEQLHTAHEAGVHSYSGQKSWSFLNAVMYCLTVITTIGYGHISPSTTTGRALTIVYAIFGIPMFLIILADFGKLFTRGIKFLWAFVRRVYYTGSCRRVRRTVPVQEVMKGVQLVYDFATFRRPSQMNPEEIEEMQKQQSQTQTVLNLDGNAPPSAQPDTPGTPAMSTFAIDDEFNLPISVAIVILLVYIFVGATVYNFWERWGFFESFYFVFISMSTIGFGDYVPKHPIYMMLSIVYLVFGLALTSMCINVVQVMLSDSFKQASQKISATIGFEVAEDNDSDLPVPSEPVELADIHATIKQSESKEQVAPKAKQEDIEL